MSRFSDLLNHYIEEKQVKLYTLSRLCQIDRTTLYRLTRGKQCPSSIDTVIQLAKAMKLTPQQKSRFYEAWEITSTGEGLWYQRKATERFLLNLPKTDAILLEHPWNSSEDLLPAEKNSVLLNHKEEIRTFLETMLIQESTSAKPELMLLLQPEHMDFADLLLGDPHSKNFNICNIVCLNNHNPAAAQNISSYNIECLEKMMSLYIRRKNFCSQYYYDDITMHFHSVSLMPCMILTGSSAITCSADLSFGIAHTDPAVVAMLQNVFHKYKAFSHPLTDKTNWNTQEFEIQLRHFSSRDSILFGPEPYICSWLTSEILQKYLSEDSMQNKEILSAFSSYLSAWKNYAETSEIVWYTTRSNLEYFMATGHIASLPKGLMRPLSCHDRHLYLEYLCNQAKNRPIYLIKGPLERTGNHFHLYTNAQTVFLTFPESHHSISGLTIREPSLVDSFFDLFASLKKSGQFTQKETCESIKSMI
ncbi:MAG: helix-turn-helix transcriptional regulator [Lachnospiraceae bacterium]|nr:helix-turn-helix transcriptional regulator [Lachnospiraceae bacterium]